MRTDMMRGHRAGSGSVSGTDIHVAGAVLAIILLLVSTLTFPGATGAGGETHVTDFNGADSVTLSFTGAGTDSATKLSLEKKAQVADASFAVQGADDGSGNYPTDVEIDVGADGNIEWAFDRTGYGALGYQQGFSDETTYKYMEIDKGGFNALSNVRLPRNASIVSTEFMFDGVSHELENGDFNQSPNIGWNLMRSSTDGNDVYRNETQRTGNFPSDIWGDGPYLMLASNNYPNSDDNNIDLEVDSDTFSAAASDYVRMDISYRDTWNHDGYVRIYDELDNYITVYQSTDGTVNTEVFEVEDTVIDISSLAGNIRYIQLHLSVGWRWGFDTARLCIDDVHLCDSGGQSITLYPQDIAVDVGDDGGLPDYTNPLLDSPASVTGFKTKLQSLLGSPSSACDVTTDPYGNEMVTIPLNVSVQSSVGWVNITSLKVQYTYKALVWVSAGGRLLTEAVNDLVPDIGDGSVELTVAATSASAGKLWMGDVDITCNGAPKVTDIPDQSVPEGAYRPQLVDLSAHFSDDDSTAPEYLLIQKEITANTGDDPIDLSEVLSISGDGYLGVDLRDDNSDFTGTIQLTVRAADAGGLYADSASFGLTVEPKNDEPFAYIDIPTIRLIEDGPSKKIDLREFEYFRDAEGDTLRYRAQVDPFGEYGGGFINISTKLTDTDILRVSSGENWYGKGIKLYLFCDDDDDINTTVDDPHQVIIVNVTGTNDAPDMDPIPDLIIDEDTARDPWLDLADRVFDPETSDVNLTYEITYISDEDLVNVDLTGSVMSVRAALHNSSGTSDVTVKVFDPEGAMDQESFTVTVVPVNDPPYVADPVERVEVEEDGVNTGALDLFEVFADVEGPLTFSSQGSVNVGVNIGAGGKVTFTAHTENWYGTEHITFFANDTAMAARHTVSVDVLPVNDIPYWKSADKPIVSPIYPRADHLATNVSLNASMANDVETPEADLTYVWDMDNKVDSDGDGVADNDWDVTGRETSYDYNETGTYRVTLRVYDGVDYSVVDREKHTVLVIINEEYSKLGEIPAEVKDKRGETDLWWYIILLIILIVLVMVFVAQYVKGRGKVEKVDAEMVGDTVDAEVVGEKNIKPAPGAPVPPGAGAPGSKPAAGTAAAAVAGPAAGPGAAAGAKPVGGARPAGGGKPVTVSAEVVTIGGPGPGAGVGAAGAAPKPGTTPPPMDASAPAPGTPPPK